MADRKIILSEDDFNEGVTQGVSSPTQPGPAGPALPPVAPRNPSYVSPTGAGGQPGPREYALPAKPASPGVSLLVNPRTSFLVAAAAGVLLAWAVTQIFGIGDASFFISKAASDRNAAIWVAVVALLFGGVVLSFDRIVAGAWQTAASRVAIAAVPLFAVGYGSGYAANALYLQLLSGAVITSPNDGRFYLARSIGWAVFGLGVGITVGLADRSRSRAINGAIGGALGGAVGGLLFQAAASNLHTSDSISRLIGLAGIGGAIALATRAVEVARKDAWVHVVAGGMTGKEFILWHTVTRIGASPDCEIYILKDPAVIKLHAQIEDHGGRRLLRSVQDAPVLVNGAPVSTHWLRSADQIQIGSTLLAYSERAVAPTAPAAFSGVP